MANDGDALSKRAKEASSKVSKQSGVKRKPGSNGKSSEEIAKTSKYEKVKAESSKVSKQSGLKRKFGSNNQRSEYTEKSSQHDRPVKKLKRNRVETENNVNRKPKKKVGEKKDGETRKNVSNQDILARNRKPDASKARKQKKLVQNGSKKIKQNSEKETKHDALQKEKVQKRRKTSEAGVRLKSSKQEDVQTNPKQNKHSKEDVKHEDSKQERACRKLTSDSNSVKGNGKQDTRQKVKRLNDLEAVEKGGKQEVLHKGTKSKSQHEKQQKMKSKHANAEEGKQGKASGQCETRKRATSNRLSSGNARNRIKKGDGVLVKQKTDGLELETSFQTSPGSSSRKIRVMQSLGLAAPPGSPFCKK